MTKLNPVFQVLSLSDKKNIPACSGISFCVWKVPLCGLFYNNGIPKFSGSLERRRTVCIISITCTSNKFILRCKGLNWKVCWLWEKREGEIFDPTWYFHNTLAIQKNSLTLSAVISMQRRKEQCPQGVLLFVRTEILELSWLHSPAEAGWGCLIWCGNDFIYTASWILHLHLWHINVLSWRVRRCQAGSSVPSSQLFGGFLLISLWFLSCWDVELWH